MTVSHNTVPQHDSVLKVDQKCVKAYGALRDFVETSIAAAESGRSLDFRAGVSSLKGALGLLDRSTDLLLLATCRHQNFALTSHSVNVSLLGCRLARPLGFSRDHILRIGLAGLLHEIGIVRLPKGLLHKKGDLTVGERKWLRERAVKGAEILREQTIPRPFEGLDLVVEQILERENGSGFPRGLTGSVILEDAKVLGIVDAFEACIHQRPHRPALTGYQFLYELTRDDYGFEPRLIKALLRTFSLYPFNERVLLNSGEVGVVIGVNSGTLSRPIVRVLHRRDGSRPKSDRVIDLARNPSLYVERSLSLDQAAVA